uniref:Putative reverse transcriptase domain-containing protein n=1 Tax=Tanacetum cinerariifolium TaxID=118510 RepID=A0A6L2KID0_TANCI|nr:putative reverse transcriptase domain-containing protein [Tanacetum cinerariifolium]GEU48392.1 putative reverse transcriptase domain-containing protein [Tanacetum cinerariifolium]
MTRYIVVILNPSNKESGTEITKGLVLDAELLDRVFKVPITTVKCIPHGCRSAFSQALNTVLCKVVVRPDLLMCESGCYFSQDAYCRCIGLRIDKNVGLGIENHHHKVLYLSHCYVEERGCLRAKHPYEPPPSMPDITFSEPPLVAKINSVFSCIKSFPKGISCGRDGLRAQHILNALCEEGSATTMDLLKVMTSVVNLWLVGRCLPILAEFIASAPLTPLLKPDNGIRPIAVDQRQLQASSSCWYLDDEAVIGDSEEVARVLDIIKVSGTGLGLELNIKKTAIFWPSCNGMKLREGLFHVDIRRPSSGVKLLGGAVSRDANFISGLAMRRAANGVDLMGLLPQLHDPQSELLLLRSCLLGSLENIVVCGGPLFRDLQWRLASLPIRFGGLGLYSAKLVSSYAFVASRAQSWVLQDHILRENGICDMDDDYVYVVACLRDTIPSFDFSGFTNKDTVPSKAQQTFANVLFSEIAKDMEVHFDMTMRQKAVCKFLCAPHAYDFLLAIPIDGLCQHMSPVEYRTIIKYRLMIPLFPVDVICPVCRKACLDFFGEHVVHCKELSGFIYQYDMVRDVLFDICRHAGISAKIEALVNFLNDPSDGRSTLRPVDVLVFGWVGGKHACVDLTGVSPLVGLSSRGFTTGQAALKAASGKVTKHEKACIENQHVFIPFMFDTFGFLALEAVELLIRVQRVMHNNVMTPKFTDVVFKRLKLKCHAIIIYYITIL